MSQNIKDVMDIRDIKIKDLTANPAPLGLMGFGMTTVLLNIHNAGFYPMNAMILSMGFFYGGLAQVIAGIQEWKKGNTFGATAFTSYGLFWLTLFMFIGTLKGSKALSVVFFTLTILFFLLAAGNYLGSESILVIAGYEGILTGLSAIYAALGQVLNEAYGKKIVPL